MKENCLDNHLSNIPIKKKLGLLQLTATWYKIRHAGGQACYYSRTGRAKQCYFILSSLNFLCFGCPSAGIITLACPPAWRILYHVTNCKRPIILIRLSENGQIIPSTLSRGLFNNIRVAFDR